MCLRNVLLAAQIPCDLFQRVLAICNHVISRFLPHTPRCAERDQWGPIIFVAMVCVCCKKVYGISNCFPHSWSDLAGMYFSLKVKFFTLSECVERDVWSPQFLESFGMCFQYKIYEIVEMFCACLSLIGLVRTFSALSKHN